jgi:hypothetical protein
MIRKIILSSFQNKICFTILVDLDNTKCICFYIYVTIHHYLFKCMCKNQELKQLIFCDGGTNEMSLDLTFHLRESINLRILTLNLFSHMILVMTECCFYYFSLSLMLIRCLNIY